MKAIHRSKRARLSYRRHHQQFPKPIIKNDNDDDEDDNSNDESDFEDQIIQQKSIIRRSNKNANQMPITPFDTIPTLPIEDKPHITIPSSSDQSSLFLYSINSIPKPIAISDDLTPLTVTTNKSALTILTCSNTKQTELTSTDTLNTSSDRNHSLSLDRKLSSVNINNTMQAYDTDTSMKSVVFSKQNSLEDELLRQKHTSCFAIPGIQIEDSMTMETSTMNTNVNTCQRLPVRWNPSRWSLPNMTRKFQLLIVCLSLSLIAGIVLLIITL